MVERSINKVEVSALMKTLASTHTACCGSNRGQGFISLGRAQAPVPGLLTLQTEGRSRAQELHPITWDGQLYLSIVCEPTESISLVAIISLADMLSEFNADPIVATPRNESCLQFNLFQNN